MGIYAALSSGPPDPAHLPVERPASSAPPEGVWPLILKQGDLIQVLEYGASIPPALDLGDLLFVGDKWEADPPLAFSSSFSHFWVLHEGGAKGIDADYHAIDNVYGFQEFVADTLQFAQHRTSLKTASPQILDGVYRGVLCKAVVIVTECLPTIPVPPARITVSLTVVFLDMRPVLRGIDWRILARGETALDVFTRGLHLEPPQGYRIHIEGGHRVTRKRVVFLKADDRAVLTVSYVEQTDAAPETASTESNDSSDSGGDSDSAPDDGDPNRVARGTHAAVRSSEEDAPPPPPLRVRFRILVPGYTAENVEDARCREHVQNFPRLIPASPQPLVGDGVMIACPAWSIEGHMVISFDGIVNATLLTGLFALHVIGHCYRHDFLKIALSIQGTVIWSLSAHAAPNIMLSSVWQICYNQQRVGYQAIDNTELDMRSQPMLEYLIGTLLCHLPSDGAVLAQIPVCILDLRPLLLGWDWRYQGTPYFPAIANVWMLHFGKQEQGQATPIDAFIKEATYSCYQPDLTWTAAMLPTYADIESVVRAIPRNKAAGLDNIPGEILKAVPAEAARLLLPLFLKSMVLQHQPIQWRGGVLFEAFKRSGLQSSVDNYRSLFVSSYLAKAFHRVVRDKTQAFCRDEMHSLHLGSKKRAPVTFASMYVLAHLRRGSALRQSVSVLYLDTSAAYYRIVRELAVGDIRADSTVLRLFTRFGLTGDDLHELMMTVESGGMLAQAGAPDALRQVVKDIHLHTWFVSRFSDGTQVCSSLAGSRPGESWADLIYAYIYGRVLSKIHEYAVAEDLTFRVSHDPTAGVFPATDPTGFVDATDATWADDSAFPLIAEDPGSLMQKTRRLCTLVISFCEGHGMAPNLKPGKTSVMISLKGKGHNKARQQFFPNGAKKLDLPDLGVGIVVADCYKHLGGYVDCKLSMKQEVRHRLAQASSSYDSARTLLLGNPRLGLATRAALFESAVTPTFFNIGLWIPCGPSWDSLCNGYSKLVRRMLVPNVGAHRAFHVPLPVVHWYTGCWRLELIARRARLSLLVSLVQTGPPLLWAMLQAESTWLQTIQEDLRWLIRGDEEDWPLLAAPAHQDYISEAGLSVHFFKKHGRVAAYRHVADGTTCAACDTSFWTVGRLAAHLRASPGCVAALAGRGHFVERPAPGFGSRKRRQADSLDFTLSLPDRRGIIPPRPEEPVWGKEQKQTYHDACDVVLEIDSSALVVDIVARISAILFQGPLYYDELLLILDRLSSDVTDLHRADSSDPWGPNTVHNILSALERIKSSLGAPGLPDIQSIPECHSLLAFKQLVTTFEWPKATAPISSADGTLSPKTFTVLSRWEADWRQYCGRVEISAVADDCGVLLPTQLRQAWHHIIGGCTVLLDAPPEFWSHPLAAPFRCACPLHVSSN
ncbi:unnamed protein product [Symbiodinium sp. KB8]|nr:unnamed protein product [Symbiodinium sp. KB8]